MGELAQKYQVILQGTERYLQLARLTPARHLLLLLAPACGASVLAGKGFPGAGQLLGVLVTALCLWGLAWGFNDWVNAQRLDGSSSYIGRGIVTKKQALALLAALGCTAVGVALLLGGRFSSLAVVPLLVAGSYPWLRRYTYLIDAWFGLGIAWTVPLAYAAAGRWPDKVGALLGVVTLLWAMGWMVLHQWPRHGELLERGMRTLGLMFASATGKLVIALQAAVLLGAWMAATQGKFGTPYSVALLFAAVLSAGQAVMLYRQGVAAVNLALWLHLASGAVLWLGVALHFLVA